MLAVGRERAAGAGAGSLDWMEGNAEALPFASRLLDGYTIAFGIRNVPRIAAALAEARRSQAGGRFLCLEFSKPDVPGLDALYDAYSFTVIPRLGQMVTGDAESYRTSSSRSAAFRRPRRSPG
jgi:demethylmenaquinone methyltransferase/2-methoxy-6-polyprenyl-1,4-benzoquinol methylase